ncbi:MAG: hypothetical protein J6Y54_05610 [Lentisphaeria bacterium]|nr:hypothetical protein [Lentisphaeria bacterium]
MKEIPMLFNTAMVRAILEDRKTQTRRLTREIFVRENPIAKGYFENEGGQPVKAPARVGDLIYVREAWCPIGQFPGEPPMYWYKADYPNWPDEEPDGWLGPSEVGNEPDRWRPSFHMPKAAARIWLEVTGVRAEPLQHITVRDAAAEGCGTMRDFPRVWDACYGKTPYSWKSNPFVCVVEFKRAVRHGA